MATIAPRKNDKGDVIGYQAKVRRRGFPVQSKTFDSRKAAEDWGKVIEAEMIRGVHVNRSKAERTTFGQVISDYIANVAPTHKGGEAETLRLKRFQREEAELCAYSLTNLRTSHFEEFMRRRLDEVAPGTVKRELGLLHSVIEGVRKAYGMVENPISDVRRPQVNDARDVRLHGDDEGRLLAVIEGSRGRSCCCWARACPGSAFFGSSRVENHGAVDRSCRRAVRSGTGGGGADERCRRASGAVQPLRPGRIADRPCGGRALRHRRPAGGGSKAKVGGPGLTPEQQQQLLDAREFQASRREK